MSGEARSITRSRWARIIDSSPFFLDLELPEFNAAAALMQIKKVTSPLVVTAAGHPLTIADDGYSWMQLAPECQYWWMSVMFDRSGHIIQYYFDTTKGNHIDGDRSYFIDLYLDVVALPDGRVELLDRDELDNALDAELISLEEYTLSVATADMLLKNIPKNISRLNSFCYKLLDQLKKQRTDSE